MSEHIILKTDRLTGHFSPLGASLVALKVLTEEGRWRDVAMSPLPGSKKFASAGRTIGPCCGRVRGAVITIEGTPRALDANENGNHLHGGFQGVSDQRWEILEIGDTRVRFGLSLPDGLGGYPGNRRVEALYVLEENALSVSYSATTDAATWICMTNHAYWDLTDRFDGSAMNQRLQIPADRAVFNDTQHLPQTIESVEGTPFDFRTPTAPAEMLRRFPDHPQLAIARGFNNALIFEESAPFAARLTAPDGSLSMTMTTDFPALIFYSGGFLSADTLLPTGPAVPGAALALEAQTPPDPFHLEGVEPELTHPGETWSHFIRWEFCLT